MAITPTELAAVKVYMKVDGSEDDAVITTIWEAAKLYISGAGVKAPASGTSNPLYDLAVWALTLHWYDNRDALAEQIVPSGYDRMLGQLKHREGQL